MPCRSTPQFLHVAHERCVTIDEGIRVTRRTFTSLETGLALNASDRGFIGGGGLSLWKGHVETNLTNDRSNTLHSVSEDVFATRQGFELVYRCLVRAANRISDLVWRCSIVFREHNIKGHTCCAAISETIQ